MYVTYEVIIRQNFMNVKNRYFVTSTDTGMGKTIVSAILCKALKASYWKPIQCGDLHESDSKQVASFGISTTAERYALSLPQSPHTAAAWEEKNILLEEFEMDPSNSPFIVEGAGGVLVPLNDKNLLIDLIKKLDLSAVVVVQHYLGSLNHTLLTMEALKARNIHIAGMISNRHEDKDKAQFLSQKTKIPFLFHINEHTFFDEHLINYYAHIAYKALCEVSYA